ncbi:MAG: FHA domain-containing protein [Gammaproteobacteria bacterium]
MTVLAIEINDSGIRTARDGNWQQVGPGLALLDPDRPLIGEEARAQARLRPRRLQNRFWQDLNLQPLSRVMPYAGNNADLACAQLKAIWDEQGSAAVEAVIFLVPGFFTSEALGLLLGVAEDCDMPVRGVIDTAVAATPELNPGRSLMHLDIHLHSTVLTELIAANGVARGEVQVLDAVGLSVLEQSWMGTTAEAFIRQTRFDPLHDAGTEQILADHLESWLDLLAGQAEATIELQRGGQNLSASLSRRQLVEVAAPHYERLARLIDAARLSRGPITLNASSRMSRLPGLLDRLAEIEDVEVVALADGQAILHALERSRDIVSPPDNVRFVTMLPFRDHSQVADTGSLPPPPMEDSGPRPTHLLAGSVVYRLSDQPVTVGAAPPADQRPVVVSGVMEGVSRRHCSIFCRGNEVVLEDHSRYGTFLNDHKVQGEAMLKVGDVVRVGSPGSSLLLVEARD